MRGYFAWRIDYCYEYSLKLELVGRTFYLTAAYKQYGVHLQIGRCHACRSVTLIRIPFGIWGRHSSFGASGSGEPSFESVRKSGGLVFAFSSGVYGLL